MSETIKVTLVDKGQDFTEWYIKNNKVIDCQPFQGALWVGTRIVGQLMKGKPITIIARTGEMAQLNYPVEEIEVLSEDEAELVELYYQGWLEIIGRKKAG